MDIKILLVDGDPAALRKTHQLLSQEYLVESVSSCELALARILETDTPFSVIVSELTFEMSNGIDLLKRAAELSPKTIRIVHSLHSRPDTLIQAINLGNVFSFIPKPLDPEKFLSTIRQGVDRYVVESSENETLTKTLTGSVHVLMEILSIVNPKGFGMASVIRNTTKKIAQRMKLNNVWECEIAAMLCLIGTVSVPVSILEKVQDNEDLSAKEGMIYQQHPEFGASLVKNIPRLKTISQYIKYHHKSFNGDGYPKDDRMGEDIPIGARILRVASDFEQLRESGLSCSEAFSIIQSNETAYDLQVVAALEEIIDIPRGYISASVNAVDLPINCILSQDVVTSAGMLLILNGQIVDETTKTKIIHHSKTVGVKQPIHIRYRRFGASEPNAKS